MSYEGFEQVLCKNGHLREFDCWNSVELFHAGDLCPVCNEVYVYRHGVNETNWIIEDDPSTMRRSFMVNVPECRETCNLGHQHIVVEARYKIPEKE